MKDLDYWRALSRALFAAVAAYLVFFSLTRPSTDWDMVPYTMATLRDGSLSTEALHAKTWALVKAHVSAGTFRELTTGSAYREAQYASPVALASQMPLFESKYGFVLLLKTVALVADPLDALVWLSLIGALATLVVLFHEASRLSGIACLSWFPFAKLFGLSAMASLPTPDSMATGIYVVGFWALLSGRLWLAVALLVAGTFVRPDNALLNAALCLAVATLSLRATGVLLAGSIAAVLLDMSLGHHIGWWRHFYYNFIEIQSDLAGFDPPFDLRIYGLAIMRSLKELPHWDWVYEGLAACLLALAMLARRNQPLVRLLLLALIGGAVAKFVVYPSVEGRLYSPILFGLAVVALRAARPLLAEDR